MIVLNECLKKDELNELAKNCFGDMIKAVVDVERRKIAVDAELHADLEALLLENGSEQSHLWGINLYPEMDDENFIEYDSLINIRPAQDNRSRDVEDANIREIISDIVGEWIK